MRTCQDVFVWWHAGATLDVVAGFCEAPGVLGIDNVVMGMRGTYVIMPSASELPSSAQMQMAAERDAQPLTCGQRQSQAARVHVFSS